MPYSDALKAIQDLSRNADTLAALGALLSDRAGEAKANGTVAAKLDAVQRAVNPTLLENISNEEARFLFATVRANLRRALELVEAPDQPACWDFEDPVILQQQGKSSRIVTRIITDFALRTPSLAEKLRGPSRFLDVGSGTGWISISMAEHWPSLFVDGIDIHAPALVIAEENLSGTDAASRIHFQELDIADLNEIGAYSVAFIPVMFMPEHVLNMALPALFRAIEAQGWLFVATFRISDTALTKALSDLQTTLWGGRLWGEDDAIALLAQHGFNKAEDIGSGYPIHVFAAQKP